MPLKHNEQFLTVTFEESIPHTHCPIGMKNEVYTSECMLATQALHNGIVCAKGSEADRHECHRAQSPEQAHTEAARAQKTSKNQLIIRNTNKNDYQTIQHAHS